MRRTEGMSLARILRTGSWVRRGIPTRVGGSVLVVVSMSGTTVDTKWSVPDNSLTR